MAQFADLYDEFGLSPNDVKRRLPLEYLARREGVALEAQADRLVARCPFHADENPSFAVWRGNEEWDLAGCWSCDFSVGDLFAFLQRKRDLTFPAAFKLAVAYLREFEGEPAWTPTPVRQVDPRTREQLAADVASYQDNVTELGLWHALAHVVELKNLGCDLAWLQREFRLGADGYALVMPHYQNGDVTGYKVRHGDAKPMTVGGSKLTELYGAWRDTGQPRVILCEGESDTWRVAWEFRAEGDLVVLGLPSGASQTIKDEWIARLKRRDVTVLFDGDAAGQRARERWVTELLPEAGVVRVALPERGEDACSCLDLRDVVASAVTLIQPLVTADRLGGPELGYVIPANPATNRPARRLTTWELEPVALVLSEDERAVAGRVVPGGAHVTVSPRDWRSRQAMVEWATARGLTWNGQDGDAQAVWDRAHRDAAVVQHAKLTRQAGWREGNFVLPNACLGPRLWVYVPEHGSDPLQDHVEVLPGPVDRWIPDALVRLHAPEATTPLVAWFAAAPLRDTVKLFPILSVTGVSGSGKTTLTEEVARTFGWGGAVNLSAVTPYGIVAKVTASNGVPLVFDEYRQGGRGDSKQTIDDVVRSAWSKMALARGGRADNPSALHTYVPSAPLVIVGEDAQTEKSQVDRIAAVTVPVHGKNEAALGWLRGCPRTGFGHLYLEWLVNSWHAGTLPQRDETSLERHGIVLATLEWGWALFTEFATLLGRTDLGELQLDAVNREFDEAEDPHLPAIRIGMENTDKQGRRFAWTDRGETCVRTNELVAFLGRGGFDVKLPGGATEFRKWLRSVLSSRNDRRSDPLLSFAGVGAVRVEVFATPEALVEAEGT